MNTMNRKTYETPSTEVLRLATMQMLANSITNVDGGDTGIGYGGGGSGPARGRRRNEWVDSWDEDDE